MLVNGEAWRPIWLDDDGESVGIIDQTKLPFRLRTRLLKSESDAAEAIKDMQVRGAPLIGATAAYGMADQMAHDPSDASLSETWDVLHDTRPTAINLRWALNRCRAALLPVAPEARAAAALALAHQIADVRVCLVPPPESGCQTRDAVA